MIRSRHLKTWLWPSVVIVTVALAAVVYTAGRQYGNSPQKKEPRETVNVHTDPNGHEHAKGGCSHATTCEHAEADGCQDDEAGQQHEDEVTLTPEAVAQNSIRLEAARRQPLTEVFAAPARVSYNIERMAHVGTPVSGRVAEISVRLGDTVKAGDVLLVIDSPTLGEAQSDFLQKRTQVQVAQSAFDVAKSAAERARRLLDGKGISLSEHQRREGESRAADGALRSAEAALTAAENRLHLLGLGEPDVKQLLETGRINPRYSVRAPLSGCVVEREATLGEVVGPERDALLVLADLSTLWVLADIPENLLPRITIGSSATLTVGAIQGRRFTGRVGYIAPALEKATRTGQVRIEIADGRLPLRPGMFAEVRLHLKDDWGKEPPLALVVPEAAVQMVEGEPAVFVEVAGEPNTFAKQAVKVGPAVRGMIPILAGLQEGKPIVVEGTFLLKAELIKAIMEGKTCTGH